MVTSGFGFGKTSLLHALAHRWIETGRHAIYVPAALLEAPAFKHGAGLAEALLDFVLPEGSEIGELGLRVFRDALKDMLSNSRTWILLIDGLDENPSAFNTNNLTTLWGSIADLGVPTVLSIRDELFENRRSEFFAAPTPHHDIHHDIEQIRLMDWTNALILEFIIRFSNAQGADEPPEFCDFREQVQDDRYEAVYGDIPKRPLFLGMLATDAWSGEQPARRLHRLYGKYFRRKLHYDYWSTAAQGTARRPSVILETLGIDEATERLILLMQDVAYRMSETIVSEARLVHIQKDTIPEIELWETIAKRSIPSTQIEDILLHSLLQPAGRDRKSRERLLKFAHRSFQDWFLARYLATQNAESNERTMLPKAVSTFLNAMRQDLIDGHPLP